MRRLSALLAAAGLLSHGAAAQAVALGAGSGGKAPSRALRSASPPPAPASSIDTASREAYVTFVVSEAYVLGARVLGQSLRESGTVRCAPPRGPPPALLRASPGSVRQ